jgi:hypothetical protein
MSFRISTLIPSKIIKKLLRIVTEGVKTRGKFRNWMTQTLIKKSEKIGIKIFKMLI